MSDEKMVFSDYMPTDFVVADNENNIVYQGKEHPFVVIFERLERIERFLNLMGDE